MNKNIKIFFSLIIILFLLCFILFLVSLLFPGKLKVVDDIRLPIQGEIMGTVGDYVLGDFYLDENGNVIEGPDVISLNLLNNYLSNLSPGDIFFTNSEKYLSSEFIPGKWKHSVIYIGNESQLKEFYGENSLESALLKHYYENEGDRLIIDAGSHGVSIRPISKLSNLEQISFLNGIIAFKINATDKIKKDFLNYALLQNGKKYNYDMTDIDDETFYCSQLIYKGLYQIGLETDKKSIVLTREYISPQDLVDYIIETGIEKNEFSLIFQLEKIDGELIVNI